MSDQQRYKQYGLPLYENNWSALDDFLLLKVLNEYGAQNWQFISQLFNKERSPEQYRDHYYLWFCQQAEQNTLIPSRDKILFSNEQDNVYVAGNVYEKDRKRGQFEKQFQNQQYSFQQKSQQKEKQIPKQFGFNPKTRVFNNYLFEQAEIIIGQMEIKQGQSEKVKYNRQKILEYYNSIIEKRAKIEKQTIEQGLLINPKKKKQEQYFEIQGRLGVLCQQIESRGSGALLKRKIAKYQQLMKKIKDTN